MTTEIGKVYQLKKDRPKEPFMNVRIIENTYPDAILVNIGKDNVMIKESDIDLETELEPDFERFGRVIFEEVNFEYDYFCMAALEELALECNLPIENDFEVSESCVNKPDNLSQDADKPDWEAFGRQIAELALECSDIDGDLAQDICLTHGLLKTVDFDPEKHIGDEYGSEAGDPWLEFNFPHTKNATGDL